jgi:hypothetical protein
MSRRLLVWSMVLLAPVLSAPGTVTEQRDRLPAAPGQGCDDEIVGVWMDHTYNVTSAYWVQHELTIERGEAPNELKGFARVRTWDGDASAKQPPLCDGVTSHYIVRYDAVGTLVGDQFEFYGVGDWEREQVICGNKNAGYNLDHFTGTLDRELQEFQTVNNDGGTAVNMPTVFRRLRCREPVAVDYSTPKVESKPSSRFGCGFW